MAPVRNSAASSAAITRASSGLRFSNSRPDAATAKAPQ
jgi:flagellin-like hook-associated protein FlgL